MKMLVFRHTINLDHFSMRSDTGNTLVSNHVLAMSATVAIEA